MLIYAQKSVKVRFYIVWTDFRFFLPHFRLFFNQISSCSVCGCSIWTDFEFMFCYASDQNPTRARNQIEIIPEV